MEDLIATLFKEIIPEFSRHDIYFLLFVGGFEWIRRMRKQIKSLEKKVSDMEINFNGSVSRLRDGLTSHIERFSQGISDTFDKFQASVDEVDDKITNNEKEDAARAETIQGLRRDVDRLDKKAE